MLRAQIKPHGIRTCEMGCAVLGNTAFGEQDGYRCGVRPAMWDRLWEHLTYAMNFDDLEEVPAGYPDGTRLRQADIPMV